MKIVLSNEFDEMMLANEAFTRKIMTDNITTYNIPESNFLEDASLSCFDKELCYCSKNFVLSNVIW